MYQVYVYDEMGEVDRVVGMVESEEEAYDLMDWAYDHFFGPMYSGDAGVDFEEV